MATLQPASSFMNAIRARVSVIQRAGSRSARKGPSYINGAAYSPRVLIALMNIWRVHHNFFDWRTYESPLNPKNVAEETEPRTRRLAVPGTGKTILVPLRRPTQTQRTTPAMRLGVHIPSGQKKPNAETYGADEPEPHVENAADNVPECVPESEPKPKKADRRNDDRPYLPDLSRILYQPWPFHGTPMWAKLQGR